MVAYELHKTIDEIAHLTPEELATWLAFFKIREKRLSRKQ
jgi:hypothetical protein